MSKPAFGHTRRDMLRWGVATAAVAAGLPGRSSWTTSAFAADADPIEIVMDGHVHVTNRIYWEGIDPWIPTKQGWDFARARSAGVNCIIDNIGPYGYWNYNYTPKQALRLIDTLLRFSETHSDKMAIALSPADARRIIGSGRMAVFIGCGPASTMRAIRTCWMRSTGWVCAASSLQPKPASTPSPTARSRPFRAARNRTILAASTTTAASWSRR
jgi:hypothetical protein